MNNLHQPNDIISDRYRIVSSLGQGGMGTTYEAEDLSNHQRVAIKVLFFTQMTDWKLLELFEREAQVLQNLTHPQIPKYLDYFHLDTDNDRRFYLIQELVTGESLGDLVKKGWHPQAQEVKKIATQLLEILNYLHQLHPPVIHRDIKPQNVLRRSDGQIYLVDFGAVQDVYRNTLSMGGTFVGTIGYMSPEQFGGKCYPASDLYSLGTTLIFLLTHTSPTDLPQQRMKIDFRSRTSIADKFADWLDKMIEPIREDRFNSAQEALKVLQQKQTVGSYALTTSPAPQRSSIILTKNHQNLLAEIPSENFGYSRWVCLIFFLSIVFFPLAFIILVVLLVAKPNLGMANKFKLEITPQYFRFIEWNSLGFHKLKLQGDTRHLSCAYVEKFSLFLLERSNLYEICGDLKRIEKEWLASEINDFLKQL